MAIFSFTETSSGAIPVTRRAAATSHVLNLLGILIGLVGGAFSVGLSLAGLFSVIDPLLAIPAAVVMALITAGTWALVSTASVVTGNIANNSRV